MIFSHVFHHFDDDRSRLLIERAAGALAADGRIAIHDFVRGIAPPTDDPAPYMFSTTMLGWTRHGEAYDLGRFSRLLSEGGFRPPQVHQAAPMPTRFLVADRV